MENLYTPVTTNIFWYVSSVRYWKIGELSWEWVRRTEIQVFFTARFVNIMQNGLADNLKILDKSCKLQEYKAKSISNRNLWLLNITSILKETPPPPPEMNSIE